MYEGFVLKKRKVEGMLGFSLRARLVVICIDGFFEEDRKGGVLVYGFLGSFLVFRVFFWDVVYSCVWYLCVSCVLCVSWGIYDYYFCIKWRVRLIFMVILGGGLNDYLFYR